MNAEKSQQRTLTSFENAVRLHVKLNEPASKLDICSELRSGPSSVGEAITALIEEGYIRVFETASDDLDTTYVGA